MEPLSRRLVLSAKGGGGADLQSIVKREVARKLGTEGATLAAMRVAPGEYRPWRRGRRPSVSGRPYATEFPFES